MTEEEEFYKSEKEIELQNQIQDSLNTSNVINNNLCGIISELKKNYSKIILKTTNEMGYDEEGLVHSGFIFNSANYAANVAVNKTFIVTVGAKISFLAPTKIGDIIKFEAQAFFEESRKREVKVIGEMNEIKIFEGSFQIIILEEHIFKLQKKNEKKDSTK